MSTIRDIEQHLLRILSAALPELSVEPFPERPAEYELLHPLGAVLVQYDGSTYSSQAVQAAIAIDCRARFSIVAVLRSLRSHSGIYDILQRISQALIGLRLPGVMCIEIDSEQFLDECDGVWTYVQSYACRVVPSMVDIHTV